MVTFKDIIGSAPPRVKTELEEHLKHWRTLADFLPMAGYDDVMSLLVLELNGWNRKQIVERLSARLGRIEVERIRRIGDNKAKQP